MRLTPLKIFAAAAMLSGLGAVAVSSRAAGDATLRDLSGYREWARVNSASVTVPDNVAAPGG
jgi:hypothetical protein